MRSSKVERVGNFGRIACLVAVGGALGACSTNLDLSTLYTTPGRFDSLKCSDIVSRINSAETREKELTQLMEKANQDTAGPVVNVLVYSTDLAQARADQKNARLAARQQNCENVPPEKTPMQ
jgi:hypothetical protein